MYILSIWEKWIHIYYACCSLKYDVFGDESPVDPSVLQPAKMLQWKISPSTAADIQTASNSMNK